MRDWSCHESAIKRKKPGKKCTVRTLGDVASREKSSRFRTVRAKKKGRKRES